jgi:hypothetical protein
MRARANGSFGWFEPRLEVSKVTLPPAIVQSGKPVDLGSWSIPLRVDGAPVMLQGRFRYDPPAPGTYRMRLTSQREVAPGVRVRLLPGHTPGLLLDNSSSETLLVLGADGEAFLRVGPRGVEANLSSPTWQRSARATAAHHTVAPAQTAEPVWQRVAAAPRFSWIEPRAQVPAAIRDTAAQHHWHVPVQIGAKQATVSGISTWHPQSPATEASVN